MFDFDSYWNAVIEQKAEKMRSFIADDAVIKWVCSDEVFTKDEFIKANCFYPGIWKAERIFFNKIDNLFISVHRVWNEAGESHHVTSYMEVLGDKLTNLTEFWAEDGTAPAWRKELLGR